MQIPDAAVTHRRGKAIVEGDPTRHEGRPASIGEDGDSAAIDIFPFDKIVHDVSDGRFEVGTTDDLVELRVGPGSKQIDSEQRYPALAGVPRNLMKELFLSLTGLSHANDCRRRPGRFRGRQEIGFQWIPTWPGDQQNLAPRIAALEVVARALAHAVNRAPAMTVVAIEWKRRRPVVIDGAQPVALRGQHVAFAQRSVTALAVHIRNALPFPVPGMIVRRINAAGGDTTLGDRRSPRLRSPQ